LSNRHEYGPIDTTIDLLKPSEKGKRLKSWENYYIQEYQTRGQLKDEKNTQEANPLFQLAQSYTLHNGNVRHARTPDLATTHLTGIT
jgi:hypothetical protein